MEACREAALEVEFLRKRIEAHKKLDVESRELIATLESRIANFELQVKHLKAAVDSGGQITAVDDKLLASYQASVDDAKKEIVRLRRQVTLWRRVALVGLPLAAAVGAVAGVLFSAK